MVHVNDYNCVLILYLGNNSGTEDRIREQWNGYMGDTWVMHGWYMDDRMWDYIPMHLRCIVFRCFGMQCRQTSMKEKCQKIRNKLLEPGQDGSKLYLCHKSGTV